MDQSFVIGRPVISGSACIWTRSTKNGQKQMPLAVCNRGRVGQFSQKQRHHGHELANWPATQYRMVCHIYKPKTVTESGCYAKHCAGYQTAPTRRDNPIWRQPVGIPETRCMARNISGFDQTLASSSCWDLPALSCIHFANDAGLFVSSCRRADSRLENGIPFSLIPPEFQTSQ